jgi:hypothetical protein
MVAGERCTWRATFDFWQLKHCCAYRRTYFLIPGQQNLLVTSLTVASTPGWATPWRVAAAASRNAGGTNGRNAPVEMSPNSLVPATSLDVMNRDLLSHIRLQSVQVSWAAAIAA